jgi:hypothetical protein
MTTQHDYTRLATSVSDAVDEAILLYESGNADDTELAMRLLSELGFKPMAIHRILKNPDQRRQYINDVVTGF